MKRSVMSASSCASCRGCRRSTWSPRSWSRTGRAVEQARTAATALLLRLNIPRRLHALPPATFSGGEQQRVNLARGFIGGHPILLLDEPTASLDAENRAVVVAMINEAEGARCSDRRHHARCRRTRCGGRPAVRARAAAGCRMTDETILTNAVLVLPDAVVRGTVVLRG